jgi:hypothetical protein
LWFCIMLPAAMMALVWVGSKVKELPRFSKAFWNCPTWKILIQKYSRSCML